MNGMVAIRGHFDGKVIVPDEPVDLPRNQPLIIRVEPSGEPNPAGTAAATAERLAADAPWGDRADILDSAEFARELRRQAERRGR
jgi:hypothetical protein